MPFPGLFPAWSALSLPLGNLIVWYKTPISGASNNDRITTWPDSSGNGNDGTNNGAGERPTYQTNIVNGLDTVLFGIDDVASSRIKIPTVDMSGWSAGSAYIFWKADLDPPVANQRTGMWHLGSDAGPDISTYPYLDGVVYDTGLSTDFKTVGDLTPPLTDWHLYSIHSTANDWRAYLDGANVFTTATNTFQGPGPNNTVPQIGANQGSNVMSGHIAEFLLYDIVHDTTTRQAVEAYFSARYGTF